MAKTFVAHLVGLTPYSQSKHYSKEQFPEEKGETPEQYEKRTWRERMHYDKKGEIFIPPMQFKNSLAIAAKYLSKKIPGKGQSTYTKHFEAGVQCFHNTPLGIRKDDVKYEWHFVPQDGTPGGAKRVSRCFCFIEDWEADVEFLIIDDGVINMEVFKETLSTSGNLIGIGRFRPRNRGYYGRFRVESVKEI